MKFVQLKLDGSSAVAFINPTRVLTVEAFSATSLSSKIHFGSRDSVTVVGTPAEVAAALERGME